MKLFIEEKFFSLWGGSYNVYYEDRSVAYTVQGQPSLVRRKLSVNDPQGNEVGMLQTKIIAFLPAYTIWKNGQEIGRVQQKFSLLQPKFDVNFKNWRVEGNFMGWNYKVYDEQGRVAATVDQQIWNLTEHFVIVRTRPCLICHPTLARTVRSRVDLHPPQFTRTRICRVRANLVARLPGHSPES